MRALADESVHPDLIAEMRSHGWDVIAVAESSKLRGKTDREIHSTAARWNRLLVSTDRDFSNDRLFPLQNGPGILLLSHTVETNRRALMQAGPVIQFCLNIDKHFLPWNKFIASASELRWRGLFRSGEFYDDVIWEARPRTRQTKSHKRKA